MKLSHLYIEKFKQFKKLDLDLTYPIGHEKQGKPLDKICFIGQSGTGKTNILNLILQCSVVGSENEVKPLMLTGSEVVGVRFLANEVKSKYAFDKIFEKNRIKYLGANHASKVVKANVSNHVEPFAELLNRYGNAQHLYFFPASSDFAISKSFYDSLYKRDFSEEAMAFSDKLLNQLVFCHQETLFTITSVLSELLEGYNIKEREARIKATYLFESHKKFDLLSYLNSWYAKNPNPIDKITNGVYSEFIKKLNIGIGFDKKSLSITYTSNASKKVGDLQFVDLSSGARQLLTMLMPLLVREPNNAILLIDEPEGSLFPDVQRDLIKIITSLGSDNQYFFATHSPIVASSFEPSERFFLFVDEDGNIDYKRGVSPEGDDPNDLLLKDFELRTVLGVKGEEMYNRFLSLKMQFELEENPDRKMDIANEFMEIAMDYGFKV